MCYCKAVLVFVNRGIVRSRGHSGLGRYRTCVACGGRVQTDRQRLPLAQAAGCAGADEWPPGSLPPPDPS
ncbi:unnamed protein product [Colias eurytheme]|nr:unnamed protein product [Colias eurytheme]